MSEKTYRSMLLVWQDRSVSWTHNVLGIKDALLLPIVNKAWVHYWMDWCFLHGIQKLRLVSDSEFEALQEAMNTMQYSDLEITYELCKNPFDRAGTLARNAAFHTGEPLLYAEGFFFAHYDKNVREVLNCDTAEAVCLGKCDGGGLYGLPEEAKLEFSRSKTSMEAAIQYGCSPLNSVKDYYEANMKLCETALPRYALDSFPAGNNIYIGSNTELPLYARYEHNIVIGSNVRIGPFVQFEPASIIGDGCCVDAHTTFSHCVVLPNTYVGAHLELRNKIVVKRKIIDPIENIIMECSDSDYFSAPMETGRKKPFWHYVRGGFWGALLLIVFFPIWLLTLPLCFCVYGRQLRKHFSLDYYGRYWRAMKGELNIVGAPERLKSLNLPCGVYSYSQYQRHQNDALLSEIDELYYAHNRTRRMNFKIVLKILIVSLIIPDEFRYADECEIRR